MAVAVARDVWEGHGRGGCACQAVALRPLAVIATEKLTRHAERQRRDGVTDTSPRPWIGRNEGWRWEAVAL